MDDNARAITRVHRFLTTLVIFAKLLCLLMCLFGLLRPSKLQESLAHPSVSRGIHSIQCKCLFVGSYCLVAAPECHKHIAHAYIRGRQWREHPSLLKGREGFVVALQPDQRIALASIGSSISIILAQCMFI